MSTTTVLRVERADGSGPYNRGLGPLIRERAKGSHPTPLSDGLRCPFMAYDLWGDLRYGFRDEEQLWDWFNTEAVVLALQLKDFHLAVYEVEPGPYTDEGWSQVCFDRDHATRVELKSLLTTWKGYLDAHTDS